MKWHPANLTAIRRRFPRVCEVLEGVDVDCSELDFSKLYPNDGVLEDWAREFDLVDGGVYITCGFGDGRQIEKLLEVHGGGYRLVVCEADLGGFNRVMGQGDYSKLLEDERVILGVGSSSEQMFSFLDDYKWSRMEALDRVIYVPIYNRCKEVYDLRVLDFFKYVSQKYQLDRTVGEDRAYWNEMVVKNLALMGGAPDVSELKGVFKGWPMVLVSAGPSLDGAYDFLREVRDRVLLVCVNTAYGALAKEGIVPDITVAVDPREYTDWGYRGCETGDSYLMAPFIVNEGVARRFEGRTFVWSTKNRLVNKYAKLRGVEYSEVDELGTVAASVPGLASMFGCEEVYFVGQDLAYGQGDASHAKGTFYMEREQGEVVANIRVEGNTGQEVKTDERMGLYIKIMGQVVGHYGAGVKFYNTSQLGARIPGVPYCEYDQALKQIGGGEGKSAREVLEQRCVYKSNDGVRQGVLEDLGRYLEGVIEVLFCSLKDGVGMGNASSVCVKLCKQIDSDPELKGIVFEGLEEILAGLRADSADLKESVEALMDYVYRWVCVTKVEV